MTLRSGSSGRDIEVGDDLWLYASSYTNNKPSVRFEVVPVPDELARALAHTQRRAGAGEVQRADAGAADGEEGGGSDGLNEEACGAVAVVGGTTWRQEVDGMMRDGPLSIFIV